MPEPKKCPRLQQLEQRYVPDEGEKVRLLTLDHLDGRCLVVRRVRRVETEIATDLGGAELRQPRTLPQPPLGIRYQ